MELEGGEVDEISRAGGARHHLDGLCAFIPLRQINIHIQTSHSTRVSGQLKFAQVLPMQFQVKLDVGSQIRVAVATDDNISKERGVNTFGGAFHAIKIPAYKGICKHRNMNGGHVEARDLGWAVYVLLSNCSVKKDSNLRQAGLPQVQIQVQVVLALAV